MKLSVILGIVLIVLGGLALAYQGITYIDREEVVDLGPIEVQTEQKKTFPLPPVLGVIALAGGIGLVVYGSRKAS